MVSEHTHVPQLHQAGAEQGDRPSIASSHFLSSMDFMSSMRYGPVSPDSRVMPTIIDRIVLRCSISTCTYGSSDTLQTSWSPRSPVICFISGGNLAGESRRSISGGLSRPWKFLFDIQARRQRTNAALREAQEKRIVSTVGDR